MPDTKPLSMRDWVAFWSENVRRSLKAASDQSSLGNFTALLISAVLGVAGVSTVTTSTALTVLGAPLGLVAWWLFLCLFVTPAAMWSRGRRSAADELSVAQRTAMRSYLGRFPRPASLGPHDQYRYFIIFPIPGNPDAAIIAAQIRDTFGRSGFNAQLISNELPGEHDVSRFGHGIWLRGNDAQYGDYDPPTFDVISEALRMAAIEFHALPSGGSQLKPLQSLACTIVIG